MPGGFLFLPVLNMNLYYLPDISGEINILPKEESHHLIKVMRSNIGDHISLVDGNGGYYKAEIITPDPQGSTVKVINQQQNFNKRPYYLHIAISPTKNISRFEWFLEKATEIGIDEITPLECQRSERTRIKRDRLDKILISGMKQSLKAYLPRLRDIQKFHSFINDQKGWGYSKYLANGGQEYPHLFMEKNKAEKTIILIGPEGDFTPNEIELAVNNGFKVVSLGRSRLRTETAGIVACEIINILNEQ